MVNVVGPDIALGDPASAQHSLAYIDKDADFAFSAVMTPDGKIPAFSGSDEVKNDVSRQLTVVSDPQLIRQDQVLIALYPLKPGTREIGTVAVGMATAKVQATVTRMVVKTILIAAVGIGITLIVILLLSTAVVRRNRDLKLIMDNVEQGFLSVTRKGILLPEHSTILLSWFGPWQPGKHLWDYLQTMAPKYGETVQWLWENVTSDVLPIDMALEQIPTTIESGGKTFRFVFKPIFDGETLLNVLIVVSDISAEIEQEKSKGEQRELVGIFQWLLKDKNGLVDFFADADRLVHDLTKGPVKDFVTVKRDVHTLKGNCGIFGIQSVVAVCQEIENHFEEGATDMSIADATKLTAIWQAAQDKRSQLFAGDDLKADQHRRDRTVLAARGDRQTPAL